jgi:hypothetical protein
MDQNYQNDYWEAFQNWNNYRMKVDQIQQHIENAKGGGSLYKLQSGDISTMDEFRQAWERYVNISQSMPNQQ